MTLAPAFRANVRMSMSLSRMIVFSPRRAAEDVRAFPVPAVAGMRGGEARRVALRRRQGFADAAGAHEAAGQGAGVLAALEDRRAGDDRRFVALDALHEAAAAGRHVVDEL